jgi:hypothetical protein
MTNREKLISLMTEYNLKARDVAVLLKVSYITVRVWRTLGAKQIPDSKLELLKLKLQY